MQFLITLTYNHTVNLNEMVFADHPGDNLVAKTMAQVENIG